jgi:hypothetical protein
VKREEIIAMAVLLAGSLCYGQAPQNASVEKKAPVGPEFSITVAPASEPIHLGAPINIVVTVTNITAGEIYWKSDKGKDSVYKAFSILLMKDGHEGETTFSHRKVTGRIRADDPQEVPLGSSIALPLPPGKMFAMTIDLIRLYSCFS